MSTRYLLISDPPHGDVDAAKAAPYFGLAVAEVRMKANYGLPEIWITDEDEDKLSDTAAALVAAGISAALVAGGDLVEVPEQSSVDSFTFTDDGLRVARDDSEWTLAYDAPTIAVVCRPRIELQETRSSVRSIASRLSSWGHVSTTPRHDPDAAQDASASLPFFDLYTRADDALVRTSFVQEVTTFPPVPANSPHGMSAMRNLVAECEERFEKAYFDHRLVDMRLRGTAKFVTGAPQGGPVRSGFSYATEALAGLLGSLSPELRDISQTDLSSRLAYLTSLSRIP